ncbi:MAG: EAL and HDOD domain-containing protein [Eubacteriales bacterium]
MEVFVARQPIFNRLKDVVAYELFYRKHGENSLEVMNKDSASATVIMNSFFTIGLEKIAENKHVFIKFTDTLLNYDIATLLNKEKTVIEIMSEIQNTDLIKICEDLKCKGYQIALDDYTLINNDVFDDIIHYVDIIKVDFLINSLMDREDIVKKLSPFGVKLLAERVENIEDFQEAYNMGFDYFQGYFFSKPEIIADEDIPSFKLNSLHIINELNRVEPDYDIIAEIMKRDLSLSYKLLRLVNSVVFNLSERIQSLRHALVFLGFNELRKFMYLLLLYDMCQDKPGELIKTSLVRAKFGELLCNDLNNFNKNEIFLMEMFSLIDGMLNKPLQNILEELPLQERAKDALQGSNNEYFDIHQLILAYEGANWEKTQEICNKLSIDDKGLSNYYIKSIAWVEEILETWNNC